MALRSFFPLLDIKLAFADVVCASVNAVYSRDVKDMKADIAKAMTPPKAGTADLGFPCFVLGKRVGVSNPAQIASALGTDIQTRISAASGIPVFSSATSAGPYINCVISTAYLAQACMGENLDITSFLAPRLVDQKKVMIEYSQPNTHKAFHVGHMRNVALGDALVRIHSHTGFPVIAANYFGDEGNHIAHCLWLLRQQIARGEVDLKTVPPAERGEFLGERYSQSVQMLDMGNYTTLPFPGIFAAKVLEVTPHPAPDAPANWHKVLVQHSSAEDGKATVVCGGAGYAVGDMIAYVRVGGKYKGKDVIEKDMKGVVSCGVIMGRAELDLPPLPKPQGEAAPDASDEKAASKKKKGGKGGKPDTNAAPVANEILVLPAGTAIGTELPEVGRLSTEEAGTLGAIPADKTVTGELAERKTAVRAILRAMESGDADICALWSETKQWSLAEFKRIYAWLGARFDHDFFESEVGE